mgnify:CR=1 FL=1
MQFENIDPSTLHDFATSFKAPEEVNLNAMEVEINPESNNFSYQHRNVKNSGIVNYEASLSTLNNPYYQEVTSSDFSESKKSCSDRFIPSRKYIKGMEL